MATVEVIIKTIDQGSEGLKRYSNQLSSLRSAVAPAAAAVAAVGAALFAASKAAQAFGQSLERGADLSRLSTQFENLAGSIGMTGDALRDGLRSATAGMVSDANLMATATQIISYGLADTGAEVTELTRLVSGLGLDMQVLTLTLANDSKMRLDNLGLSVEGVTKKVEELKAAGVDASEAFDLAVIDSLREKYALLGDQTQDVRADIDRLKAAFEDAKNAFDLTLAENLADTLSSASDESGQLALDMQYAAQGAADLVAWLAKLPIGELTRGGLKSQINELYQEIRAAGNASQIADADFAFFPAASGMTASVKTLQEAHYTLSAIADQIRNSTNPELRYMANWTMPGMAEVAGDAANAATNVGKLADHIHDLDDWLAGRNRSDFMDRVANARRNHIGETPTPGGWWEEELERQEAIQEMMLKREEAFWERRNAMIDAYAQRGREAGAYFYAQIEAMEPGGDLPLISPDRWVTGYANGITQQQSELMAEYRDRIAAANQEIYNLTHGVGTYGMEQDDLNDKIADANGELAHYTALLGSAEAALGGQVTSFREMSVNAEVLDDVIRNMGQSMGITAPMAAELGIAMGDITPAMGEAAIKAAILNDAIQTMFKQWQVGMIPDAETLLGNIDSVVNALETKTLPELTMDLIVVPQMKARETNTPIGDPHWFMENMGGEEVKVPMVPEKAPSWESTLADAMQGITGMPEADRTVEVLTDLQAILDATGSEIPEAVAAIPPEARTVEFLADTTDTDAAIDIIEQTTLTIQVNFVPGPMPQMPNQQYNVSLPNSPNNNTPQSSYMANGGSVYAGMPYIVGEAGKELFIPSTNGTIVPHVGITDQKRGGGNVTVEYNMYLYGPSSPGQVKQAVREAGAEFLSDFKRRGGVA